MRTTLTLDPDVERVLAAATHHERRAFKDVVNDAIGRGLTNTPSKSRSAPKLPPAHHTGLRPGFDMARFNALVDELETEAFALAQRHK
jgi:hypothetical protein